MHIRHECVGLHSGASCRERQRGAGAGVADLLTKRRAGAHRASRATGCSAFAGDY